MAGVLALPIAYAPRITAAVSSAPKIPLVWLRGQSCTGNSQAFLQAAQPTTAELLLETLSLEYDDALMAGAASLQQNGYIAIVEGAVPTADDGVYCTIGGRSMRDIVAEVSANAVGTIAVGACAFDGGVAAAAGGSTGAAGAGRISASGKLINLPGCPVNAENLAAALVHFFTFKEFPPTDGMGRPLFAYGGLIHNQCERRPHFEFGEFVEEWGDEGAQKGWCLYKMGCKGPETFANCPTAKYADGASWSVLAGHGCIGCTSPAFWDAMGPAYDRLPVPLAFLPNVTADQMGLALAGGVAGMAALHGGASYVRALHNRAIARRAVPVEPEFTIEEPAIEAIAETIEPAAPVEELEPPAAEPEVAEPVEAEDELPEPAEEQEIVEPTFDDQPAEADE